MVIATVGSIRKNREPKKTESASFRLDIDQGAKIGGTPKN